MRKISQPVVISFALLLFPVVIMAAWRNPQILFELVSRFPFALLIGVGFMGYRLEQRRVIFVASAFALAFAYLRFPPLWLVVHPLSERVAVVSFALPIALIGLFLCQEKWLRKREFMIGAGAMVLLPLIFFSWGTFSHWRLMSIPMGWNFRFLFWHSALSFTAVFLSLFLVNPYTWNKDIFAKDFRTFCTVALLPVLYSVEMLGTSLVLAEDASIKLALAFASSSSLLAYGSFRLYWLKGFRDELTGILNRRALNDKLLHLNKGYAIAMADIDHFKRFNDSFGHAQGDTVLRLVTRHLASVENASVFRYGGEEICLVFENCDAETAAKKMEVLRESLSLRDFRVRAPERLRILTSFRDREKQDKAPALNITFSVGIASHKNEKDRPEEVLMAADGALYKAKALGRNRVVIAGSDFHHSQQKSAG